jgi:hypothetical protein
LGKRKFAEIEPNSILEIDSAGYPNFRPDIYGYEPLQKGIMSAKTRQGLAYELRHKQFKRKLLSSIQGQHARLVDHARYQRI